MSWRDQSPDIYSTASPLLIFSPLLYFSPNCLIRLLLSTIGYQLAEASFLVQLYDLYCVGDTVCSYGLLSYQTFLPNYYNAYFFHHCFF